MMNMLMKQKVEICCIYLFHLNIIKTGEISGVSVDVKSIDFDAIVNDILNKEYVDIDYEDYYKLIKFNHFDFRINSSNKLTLGNPININKKISQNHLK